MTIFRLAIYGGIIGLLATAAVRAGEPTPLFNNADLSGWKQRGGAATYAVEEGAIVGRSVPNTSNTFLTSEKEYGDFELELEFKIDDPDFNSGIQIRSHARPHGDGEQVYGYQVEIDPRSDRGWTGGIYFEAGDEHRQAGWLNDLAKNDAARAAFKLGEWNQLKIVARGRHIQTWINGVAAADFTDSDDKAFTPRGFLGLQVHSVGDAAAPKEVRWRNIKITELDSATDANDTSAVEANSGESKRKVTGLQLFGRAVIAMFRFNRHNDAETFEFESLLGKPAPDFELTTTTGETIKLQDLRGKVVLLDFWASWCGPCRMAMPEIEKVHQQFAEQPVVVLGMNQQEDVATATEAAKAEETTFTQLLDADGAVANSYGVNGIPHTVVIGADGSIQQIHRGYSAELAEELTTAIATLLRDERLVTPKPQTEAPAKEASTTIAP